MNFKKYISMAMVCALSMGTTVAFAEGEYENANSIETSVEAVAAIEEMDVLSLDQIVDLAVENNRTYKLYETKIVVAKSEVIRANASVDYYEHEALWSSSSERLANAYGAYLTPMQKENALSELLRNQASDLKDLKNTAKEQYFDIVLSLDGIESKEADIKYYEDQLKNKESELSLGKITVTDVNEIEISLKNAKLELKKLEATISAQYMMMNITIDKPLDYRFKTVDFEFDNKPFVVEDMEAQVTYNIENDDSIISTKETLEELEEELKLVRTYSASNNPNESISNGEKIIDLSESIENYGNILVTNTLNVEYNLRKSYNELQNSFDDIEIASLSFEIAKKDAEIGQIKYDAGLINGLEFRKLVQTKDDKKTAYDAAEMNYLLAVEKFKAEFY